MDGLYNKASHLRGFYVQDVRYVAVGRMPGATNEERLRNANMTNIDSLEAGLKCYQLGNLDAAEKHFRQVVSYDSGNIH